MTNKALERLESARDDLKTIIEWLENAHEMPINEILNNRPIINSIKTLQLLIANAIEEMGRAEQILFDRVDHEDGSISYEFHSDTHLYKDTEETINSPTFVKIEGARAKEYAEALAGNTLREQLEKLDE